MDTVVQITGLKQARRKLRRVGDDLHELRDLHKEIAADVVSRAKATAPVGPSGALIKTLRGSGSKTTATVRMGNKRIRYANAVHWGRKVWPRLNFGPTKSGRKPHVSVIERNAFVYRAAKNLDSRIRVKYERYIQEILER